VRRAASLIVSTASVLLWAGAVRADGPYEGQWREGPMNVRVTVQSWGPDCGPRPQSTTTSGGGVFRISQSGDHLTFHMRRERSTRGCWSENRAVRRVSSTAQAGTWRIVCRTPSEDSRAEVGRYTIQAVGSDRLTFTDVSEYDWQLNESRCQADIRATQAFTRVGGGGGETSETGGSTEPAPTRCTPGDAARVVLRPSRADVEPGGEQCFTARVVDAEGCSLRQRPRLTVSGPGSIRGNCYRAGDSDGTARVHATSGGLRAEARISVHAMDLSDLIARRGETRTDPEQLDPGDAESETASRVSARGSEGGPDLLWPGIALAAALLLLVFGAVALRLRRGPGSPTGDIALGRRFPHSEHPPPPHRESPAPEPADAADAPPDGEDLICPTCRRGYPPGTTTCPHDDTALVPYRDFARGVGENVCPTCGKRYPKTTKFCGEDGATLEPSG